MPARKSRWQAEHAPCQETITRQRQEIQGLQAENKRLREWLKPLEPWALNVLDIVTDRRIPTAEVIADGEAITAEARKALEG